jgi:DNA-binding transcriptional ArsR family regulator
VSIHLYNRPVTAESSVNLENFSYLDKRNCRYQHGLVIDLAVIDDPEAAEVSLLPVRSRLLSELAEPGSASTLATTLGLPRQNVNYHLKALERYGLVELVEERRKGNMTERVLRATALSYVISPAALDGVQPDPSRAPDRLSARWLIAVAARTVRDVGELVAGATKARKRLATFAMDGEIRFASAADRAAFAEELAASVTSLVSKYHDEKAPRGRDHRIVVAVHPTLNAETKDTDTEGI